MTIYQVVCNNMDSGHIMGIHIQATYSTEDAAQAHVDNLSHRMNKGNCYAAEELPTVQVVQVLEDNICFESH